MDELGSILREAREAQGLTLAQVENATRINQRFLAALESGEYGALPTPVHVRGYLRNYARFLQLDPLPLLERYEVTRAPDGAQPERTEWESAPGQPLQTPDNQPFFNPINFDIAGRRRDSESLMRLAIIVALLVFIGLAVNRFFFSNQGGDDDVASAVSAILGNEEALPAGTPEAAITLSPGDEPIVSTSRNESAAAPTPTRPRLPATMEEIALRLEITERTWMRVTIDGEVVFEGQGRRGESYEWTAQEAASVYTGNAIGIFVTINGIELGKLGGRSQIVDETWTTTGG